MRKARKPHLENLSPDELNVVDAKESDDTEELETDWCMKKMLGSQADFKAEKSLLEQVRTLPVSFQSLSHSMTRSSQLPVITASSFLNFTQNSTQLSTIGAGSSITFGSSQMASSKMLRGYCLKHSTPVHQWRFTTFSIELIGMLVYTVLVLLGLLPSMLSRDMHLIKLSLLRTLQRQGRRRQNMILC
jgi:hypothetical protein